ncbi:MAG: 4'-phosphopantetheinyl transferase superfamily protein [bacterium]
MQNIELIWKPYSESGVLEPGEIRLVRASLGHDVAQFSPLLSSVEQERADRFKSQAHCDRYIVGRGLLRLLLSSFTGVAPADIALETGAYGKPFLADRATGRPADLRFNLSHSDHHIVYAFRRGHEVGIDIEEIKEIPDILLIARDYFTKIEYGRLEAASQEARAETFYHLWARKEAYLKALGVGIGVPLDSAHSRPELMRIQSFRLGTEIRGALAFGGTLHTLSCFRWSPESGL